MQYKRMLAVSALLASLAAPNVSFAAPLAISNVAFSGDYNSLTVTITGKGFGSAPSGTPCSSCINSDLVIRDYRSGEDFGARFDLSFQSWSDGKIVVHGVQGDPNDAIGVAVRNPTTQKAAVWGGNLPGEFTLPVISSIQFSRLGANLTIVVTGSGFGDPPSGVPGTGNITTFRFDDFRSISTDSDELFTAGYNCCSELELKYSSWSDTQIVVSGFGSTYGENGLVVLKGDPVIITVWNGSYLFSTQSAPQISAAAVLP